MKQFYACGFFYNPYSKKVLLHKNEEKDSKNMDTWSFFGTKSKRGETPEKTLQREFLRVLKVRVAIKSFVPVYDYFNSDFQIQRHVFFIISTLTKVKTKKDEEPQFAWIAMDQVFKRHLSKRTRQDLVFFQRELNAKAHHLPTAQM